MEIYILVEKEEIVEITTENIGEDYKELEVKNIDEFLEKTKDYKISTEVENKLKEFLEELNSEKKLSSYNIKHWVSNRSFGELIDMFENDEIQKPDMQREFVWDSLKCSRLIESIILGLPIPPLFLLEVDNNKYELIDGFQRLKTLVNYVTEKPWFENPEAKRKIKSSLSSKVSEEIAGKTFSELSADHKRIIKRSTIPLIEFKQLDSKNVDSKYLIFERINTGSEKLNPMQIRKSLAYGSFIKSLYIKANELKEFKNLFTTNRIKKDEHIEAFLRVKVMSDMYYKKYKTTESGMKNILNKYCEDKKNEEINEDFMLKFKKAIKLSKSIFLENENMFKRVEKGPNGKYMGNMNISIMDSFIGVLLHEKTKLSSEEIRKNYFKYIGETYQKAIEEITYKNPFTTSTGTIDSINERYEIVKEIIGVK